MSEMIRINSKFLDRIKAIFFDLDGTLLNTEPLHFKALKMTLQEHGQPVNFEPDHFMGMSDLQVFQELFEHLSHEEHLTFIGHKNDHLVQLIETMDSQEFQSLFTPGVLNFIKSLFELKLPIALISASERAVVEAVVRKASLREYFKFVRSRNDSFRTKPCCSPYLEVMRFLKLSSHEILIFEDSPTGIKAAFHSGAKVVHISQFNSEIHKKNPYQIQVYNNFLEFLN